MVETGHRPILGFAPPNYWSRMCAMGHPKPAEGDCLALHLYGDEGQIFNGTEYLCLNWMCEFSPFYQNSRYSRFLIAMVPTDMYWKSADKVNLTLQSLLQVIVQSIQTLETAGAAGLHGTCVVFKGDWKFLVQSLSLRHHPGTDRICWCCPATKSLRCPYVDMSLQALWRNTPVCDGDPWHSEPAIKSLTHWPIIGLDIMHMLHLGVIRDLVGSVLVLLVRCKFFSGNKAGHNTKCQCVWPLNLYIMFADSTMCFARQSKGCMMPLSKSKNGPGSTLTNVFPKLGN